jgi:arsenite-transporting ATPase
MTRVLLFTGKGGTGKTTCAAATALAAAERGLRTLVMSSDPAHSLSDALEVDLGPEPTEILPGLEAQEVDLYYSMKKYWSSLRDVMMMVARWQGIGEIAAEELAALPGMSEGSALLWLDRFYHEDAYDLIVVDSAPTGETLTFLTLPQATEWWLTRAFPFQKAAMHAVGLAVRKTTGIPLDRGYDELRHLFGRLRVIHEVMADPSVTSVRLVLNPERMVIREARRAYTYLQLYGYGVDAVIANRVMPDSTDPGWKAYLAAQATYMEEIEGSFAPLPILYVPHQRQEVFGLPALRAIAAALYADRLPEAVFHDEPAFRVDHDRDRYVVSIRVPLADPKDVSVSCRSDRLVLQVAGQRRHFLLPRFLGYYRFEDWKMDGDWIRATFMAPEIGADTGPGGP